jgi:hypothetical protein
VVELPSIPNVVPQVRAPESRVTPAQIAAPYQELAQNLSKAGEVVDKDIAQPLAARAGEEAVSADGKTVTQPGFPIIGAASAEFARAARFTALGKMTPDIENKLAEIRIQHANDPGGFQSAVKGFKNTYINGDPDKGLPAITDTSLRGPVERTIDQHAGAGYRSVLEQTNQTNVTNGKTTITSQISDLSNKMTQAAFTGGADSADYKVMQANLTALYRELGSDPRMGYPQARIDSELSEMVSQHKTMAIAGKAVRMMDSDSLTGRADAKKWLIDKVYGDPTLNLTLAQRHQAVTTAMGLMEARSGENKALIEANSATTSTLLTQLHTSQPYNPITVNNAIDNSRKIGDAASFYKLTFAKGMHDWDSTMRALPLPQQMAALKSLDTMQASGHAMDFFVSRGYSREQAAGIVGNLIQESGLNPNTVHDSGTGLGIAGHRLERLDALKAYAASKGKPANDFQTQLEFIDQELNTTEGKTGAALRAAKTPEAAAAAFINYERPQGWTPENPQGGHGFANRVANAQAVAGAAGMPTTGAGAAWFNEARIEQVGRTREYLKSQATDYVSTAEKMLNSTGDLTDGMLKNISDVLAETGQDDLRKRMDIALMAHYGVKELDKLPTSVRQAWATQSARPGRGNNLEAADAELKLTPQERALYERHLSNLTGPGGVDNPPSADEPQGSRSTLYQTTVEHDGKFYSIPTVWDGKKLIKTNAEGKFAGISAEGIKNVEKVGWDKFPSYKTEAEAEARYQKMHDFMDKDTGAYFERKAMDSPIAFQVHEHMATTIAANAKAMQETPYSTYAVRTSAKPPPAYDFSNPDAVSGVATLRAGQQKAFRANDGTGPVSVFEGKEGEAFANTLTNGDPKAAAQSLAGLANLPTDIYQATLAQKPVAEAVAGMMGSKDPVRMSAAMSAADKLWRDSPADAEGTLGKAALTKLQAWQGLRGNFTPAEIAERLNASDDPSTLKAREAAKEEAEKETANLKAPEMAYKLGTGWPGIGRLTGSTPSAPFESIKGGELVADFRATYTALRTYGVDADRASDLAVQRLQSTWGVSKAAGNQVMKNPPERSYPAISGSHDWLQADLTAWVAKRAGAEFTAGTRSLEGGIGTAGSVRNWSVEGMISDGQTQGEIAAGRPPSYQVAIKKADGTMQILPSRIAFDPSDHIAEHGAKLEQRKQSVDFLRSGGFNTPMGGL